jgi:glycosyltransferase involved in cell wall biosynthesis
MRIALLVAKFEPGGLITVNSHLAAALGQRGHQVVLVSATIDPGTCDQLPESSVSLDANSSFRSFPELRSRLFGEQYDIVIASQLFMGLVALFARPRRSSTSLLLVEHSSLDYWRESRKLKDRIVFKLARIFLGNIDQIGAVSRKTTAAINEQFRNLKQPAAYLPNPVLNGDEPVFKRDDLEASRRSGIVFAGRLAPEKRVADLIRAFASIAGDVSDDFTILGDGIEMNNCVELANELGISERVHFKGLVDNVKEYFIHSKCIVLASEFEGLPTVLIEALAQGCQVVSTDCPTGPRELLENGKHGRLVEVGDIEGIAKAIKSATQKTITTDGLAEHLRQFSTENSATNYERLCVETISRRRKLYQK